MKILRLKSYRLICQSIALVVYFSIYVNIVNVTNCLRNLANHLMTV